MTELKRCVVCGKLRRTGITLKKNRRRSIFVCHEECVHNLFLKFYDYESILKMEVKT